MYIPNENKPAWEMLLELLGAEYFAVYWLKEY